MSVKQKRGRKRIDPKDKVKYISKYILIYGEDCPYATLNKNELLSECRKRYLVCRSSDSKNFLIDKLINWDRRFKELEKIDIEDLKAICQSPDEDRKFYIEYLLSTDKKIRLSSYSRLELVKLARLKDIQILPNQTTKDLVSKLEKLS